MARKKIPENFEKMKQSMIQAAIEVMLKKSMTEFSLADVAEAVGLTKAAIYWYFPNKNALIEEVAQSIYDTYIGFVNRVSESDLSSYKKLRLVVLGESDTIESAMMCVFPIKFFLESYSKDNAVKALIKKGYEQFNGLVSSLIMEGIQSGEFRSDLPVPEMAKFITGAMDGLAFQNLLVSSENIEVSREIIFSVIDRILKPTKESEL